MFFQQHQRSSIFPPQPFFIHYPKFYRVLFGIFPFSPEYIKSYISTATKIILLYMDVFNILSATTPVYVQMFELMRMPQFLPPSD